MPTLLNNNTTESPSDHLAESVQYPQADPTDPVNKLEVLGEFSRKRVGDWSSEEDRSLIERFRNEKEQMKMTETVVI